MNAPFRVARHALSRGLEHQLVVNICLSFIFRNYKNANPVSSSDGLLQENEQA